MVKEIVKQELLNEVSRIGLLSFVKVLEFFEDRGIATQGKYSFGCEASNIIFWVGLSDEVSELLYAMVQSDELFIYPTDRLTYTKDGMELRLPLVRHLQPSDGYKEKHWQPICFSTSPVIYKRGGDYYSYGS